MKPLCAVGMAVLLALPGTAWAQEDDDEDAPAQVRIPPHRYTYAGAGLFLAGGLGMSYWAQGQALRAGSISTAREHARAMDAARQSAATANMLYVMAGVTLAYGLALEFLPRPVAEKATLTFQF
jgi:hypothetical protein